MNGVSRALVALGLLAVLGGSTVLAVRYRVYQVQSGSMAPAIQPGDRIVADARPGAIRTGDVVVLAPGSWPGDGASDLVKRVVAVGGAEVVCCDGGRVTVDGRPVTAAEPTTEAFRVRVPPGRLFLVGDDAGASADSRSYLAVDAGTVAESAGSPARTTWSRASSCGRCARTTRSSG